MPKSLASLDTVIKDMQMGGLDIDASMDSRVFTKDGRAEIINEQKNLGNNLKGTGAILGTGLIAIPVVVKSATDSGNANDNTHTSTIEKVKNEVIKLDNGLDIQLNNPKLSANMRAIANGEITNKVEIQNILTEYNQTILAGTSQDTKAYLADIPDSQEGHTVLGNANETKEDHIFLNQNQSQDYVEILHHENAHQNDQGESTAHLIGKVNNAVAGLGSWANSKDIANEYSNIENNPTPITEGYNDKQTQEDLIKTNTALLEEQKIEGDVFEDVLSGCEENFGKDRCVIRKALGYEWTSNKRVPTKLLDAYKFGRQKGIKKAWNEIGNDLLESAKDLNPLDLSRRYNNLVGMYEFMQKPITNIKAVVMTKADFIKAVNQAEKNIHTNPTEANFKLYGELKGIQDTKVFYNTTSVVISGGTASSIRAASQTSRALRNTITKKSSTRYNNPQTHRENLARRAGIPKNIDLSKPNNVYGLDSQKLKTYFEMNGYRVNSTKNAPKGSGNAQVYTIHDHGSISKIQHSPASSSSTHKGEYIKFTLKGTKRDNYGNKHVYVINPNTFKGTAKKSSTVYNQQGQRMRFVNGKYKVVD